MKENRPSLTAWVVALFVLALGWDSLGRSKLPPGSVEAQIKILRGAGNWLGRFPWLVSNPLVARLFQIVFHKLSRGVQYRKCWLEQQVMRSITTSTRLLGNSDDDNNNNDGKGRVATQVLVVGAGYCTLSFRLAPQFQQVSFWEVDHPATGGRKALAFRSIGQQPHNLHSVLADLTVHTLSDTLKRGDSKAAYDPTKTTVVLLEGLLYYLSEPLIRTLFQDIDSVTGPGSVVLFDYLCKDKNGLPQLAGSIPHSAFNLIGEPLKWAINPKDLTDFFKEMTAWKVILNDAVPNGFVHMAAVQKK